MFKIDYKFSNGNYLSSANLDEVTLRYNLFLGDLILKDEKSVISMDWDWIPIFDFAICMLAISNKLFEKENSIEEFEFTESNEKLVFRKKGNNVAMSASFSPEILITTVHEFKKVVEVFYKTVVFDVLRRNDSLRNNTVFIKYLKEAEKLNNMQ